MKSTTYSIFTKEGFTVENLVKHQIEYRDAQSMISKFHPDWDWSSKVEKPVPPYDRQMHNPEVYRSYADALERYKLDKECYDAKYTEWKIERAKYNSILAFYMKHNQSCYGTIPAKYRDKCWTLAWQLGHSNGLAEVNMYLEDIAQIFK